MHHRLGPHRHRYPPPAVSPQDKLQRSAADTSRIFCLSAVSILEYYAKFFNGNLRISNTFRAQLFIFTCFSLPTLCEASHNVGKSTTCTNLGVGLTQARKKVLRSTGQPYHQPEPSPAGHPACYPLECHEQSTERSAHHPRRGHPASPGGCGFYALGYPAWRCHW